jgi:hypothetical protein
MFTQPGVGVKRRRRRRGIRRAFEVLLVLVLLAGVGYGVWYFVVRDADPLTATTASCPTPSPTATKPPVVPLPPNKVGVNVYNATKRQGLAASVGQQMRQRKFVVRNVANDPLNRPVAAAAEIRHGPAPAGGRAAATVIAQIEGPVTVLLDKRPNASVDLVLGAKFTRLRTPQQAAAAMRPTPAPTTAPTTC